MEIKASAKFVRGSPRKTRLVTEAVVGLSPKEAIARLSLTRKKVSEIVLKVIKQAAANAKNNFKLDADSLRISEIRVGDGPRAKRIDKSHGARFDSGIIKKRYFHLWVTLKSPEEKEAKKPEEKITKEENNKINQEINQKGRPRKRGKDGK